MCVLTITISDLEVALELVDLDVERGGAVGVVAEQVDGGDVLGGQALAFLVDGLDAVGLAAPAPAALVGACNQVIGSPERVRQR